jgi:mxaJ protein
MNRRRSRMLEPLLVLVLAAVVACKPKAAPTNASTQPTRERAVPPTRIVPASAPPSAGAVGTERRTLHVCADPNNMPFSNRARQGFENRLAEVVARSLDADLAYTFWPQRRGFLRMTLNARRCDVVMGVPVGSEGVLTTEPYYRSGYVFVYGAHAPHVSSFDAPELAALRIGVPLVADDGANPPAMAALARRHLVTNVRGYSVYGDYRRESPPSELVEAVRQNEVDLAVAWGPLAGYYAARSQPALAISPVPDGPGGPETFRFDIAMAVRRDDEPLRAELDRVIVEHRRELDAILREFRVPLL